MSSHDVTLYSLFKFNTKLIGIIHVDLYKKNIVDSQALCLHAGNVF